MPKRRRESKGVRNSKTVSSKRVDVGEGNDLANENDRKTGCLHLYDTPL